MKKFLTSLLLLTACSGSDQSSQTAAIIGKNDLRAAHGRSVKQGLLNTGSRQCNAFVINGNQVASALHCIGDDPLSFVGFSFSNAAGQTATITDLAFLDDRKDLVIYEIDSPMSASYELGSLDSKKSVTLLAYDHAQKNFQTTDCTIIETLPSDAAFAHECDSKPGYSGAPLLQDGRVVGLHIGYNPGKDVNYALNFDQMFDDEADIAQLEIDAQLEWPHVRSPHVRAPHVRNQHLRLPSPNCAVFKPLSQYQQFVVGLRIAKSNNVLHDRHDCMNLGTGSSAAITAISTISKWKPGLGTLVSYIGTNGIKCGCEEVF